MIAVVDYGLGNFQSISGVLDLLGISFTITSNHTAISEAKGIILPGVGSFPDGIANLRHLGLIELLDDLVIAQKRPVLGICLGYQLMAREGFEFEHIQGLGWLNASVVKLEKNNFNVRIPHVGWNDCIRIKNSPLFEGIPDDALFYYTHSYHLVCEDPKDIVAYSENGMKFVAAVQKGNIYGTQFHPEKSQRHGIDILKNFAKNVVVEC